MLGKGEPGVDWLYGKREQLIRLRCLLAASHPQLVNAAKNTLNKQRNDIVNALAADKKAQGLAAIESLEKALADFDVLIGTNDKQVTRHGLRAGKV